MARVFPPAFCQQFFDDNGKPLAAGKLFTYVAGSSTPVFTYKSINGSERNTNPIILDAAGYADFVLECGVSYKFILKDKNDFFQKQWDNVTIADISPVIEGLATDIDELRDEVDGKADKDNSVTDVTWDSETRKIKKTINGVDYDIVQVQQSLQQSDPRPINSQAVKDENYLSVKSQSWSDAQKEQARSNINAVCGGDLLPRDDNQYQTMTKVLWFGPLRALAVEGNMGASEGGALAPIANGDGSDKGKIPFVELFSDSYYNLVYRFILENCATNSDVLQALQRGQIPCFKSVSGTYVPYLVDDNGVMYVNNVFGVSDKNPMTGDALGISLRRKIYNGNVITECLWGKPYGINYFEIGKYKCNDNYHLGLTNENRMVWRRVPMDRPLTITGIGLVGNGSTINKTLMNGIFEYDGDTLTKVSDATTWTETQGYINSQENIVRLDYMFDNNSGDFNFASFSFTSPVVLKEGYNYLIPSRYNNSHTYNDPYICTYKNASPAMPWEDLVSANAENGDPVMSTARAGCKPSALMLILSDGTDMWI